MTATPEHTTGAIDRLNAALASPQLPARAASTCARLVERLSRPVRVGLFGRTAADIRWLVVEMLGTDLLPGLRSWPPLEIAHAPEARTVARLGDGSTLTADGLPGPDLLDKAPIFLSVSAPLPACQRMTFLAVPAGPDPAQQRAALAWAARRCDIAIWCSRGFDATEAAIWTAAPEKLQDHAYLATFDGAQSPDPAAAAALFHGSFAPGAETGVSTMVARLDADIDDALRADVDAAQLFLHRFGHLAAPDPSPAPAPAPAPADTAPSRTPPAAPDADTLALFSEPLLYLKRRSRALFETLEWVEEGDDSWPAEVLTHCTETTEDLRERVMGWPEDHPRARALQAALDEACDTALLLQIEGGRDQAQDAATILLQLRREFEHGLAA